MSTSQIYDLSIRIRIRYQMLNIRTRIRTDLNTSKRIPSQIRSENIRTVFIPRSENGGARAGDRRRLAGARRTAHCRPAACPARPLTVVRTCTTRTLNLFQQSPKNHACRQEISSLSSVPDPDRALPPAGDTIDRATTGKNKPCMERTGSEQAAACMHALDRTTVKQPNLYFAYFRATTCLAVAHMMLPKKRCFFALSALCQP
jgi:hypothetical protein